MKSKKSSTIKNWPSSNLADSIRSKAVESNINYFPENILSPKELEKVLSEEVVILDNKVVAKYLYE